MLPDFMLVFLYSAYKPMGGIKNNRISIKLLLLYQFLEVNFALIINVEEELD